MKGIRKNRNDLKNVFGSGWLRQILKQGELSDKEIQMIIDAVSKKYGF